MTTITRSNLNGARFTLTGEQRLSLPGDTVEVDVNFAEPKGGEAKNWTGICNVQVSITGVIGEDTDGRQRYLAEIGDYGVYDIAVNPPSRAVRLLSRRHA